MTPLPATEETARQLASQVDIAHLEQSLPPKTPRSHHVVIKLEGVNKTFDTGKVKTTVLHDINLNLYAGEFVVIYGPSGCGKSTLLHTILGLEPPTKGSVWLRDTDLYALNVDERTNFRRQKVGMVFQRPEWIKAFKVWENVAYPLLLSGESWGESRVKANALLKELDLDALADKLPTELSGGQQQRVSMARAMVADPWVIIADEPTGNLDTVSSADLIKWLTVLNRTKGRMIVLVTHDVGYLPLSTRRIGIVDGRVVKDEVDDVV
jgi:putative ABC transport system ATP-binding protein